MSLCGTLLGGVRRFSFNLVCVKVKKCDVTFSQRYSTRELLKEAYCRMKLKCRCKFTVSQLINKFITSYQYHIKIYFLSIKSIQYTNEFLQYTLSRKVY